MARWEPDARGRLLHAAVDLFAERGYEATTAAQIAERAGLTKTTLFRHFADKREILFQGQEALVALAVDGVAGAPAGSTPFEVLHAGVFALCTMHPAERRADQRGIDALLASSPELQERAVFKRSTITEALRRSLAERLGDDRQAAVLADLGVRAYYGGFAVWIASPVDGPLADVVADELTAYEAAVGSLGATTLASSSAG
ncbi:TetR/AcrR family transcriptional regulator [Microlunatus spumicola]|uniref:TetR/AcrR family transcriptional regulator n=1 Tax=Microlunatus spumicola TaxID=81499 RepID=A0ABP6WHF1_9ACTN